MSRGLHLPLQGQLQWAGLVISMCVQGGVNGQRGSKPVSLDGPCNSPLSSSLTLSDGETLSVQGGMGVGVSPVNLVSSSSQAPAGLAVQQEKSLRIGHKTHKGGLQAFRPGAIWTHFLTQCSQTEPLLVALSHPVLDPPPQRILDTLGGSMFLPSWRQQTWTQL